MWDRILCLSGGIDSTIAYFKENKPQTIFFDTGTYSDAEKEAVLRIAPHTIIDKSLDFSNIKVDESGYIPNRNFLFAARASQYSNEIIIAGMKDDLVSDKTPEAFEAMSKVLTKISKDAYQINVTSPFWDMTKAEAVAEFLDADDTASEVLINTFSCYTPKDGKECHTCPACFRKWNALWENKIITPFYNIELMDKYYNSALHEMYSEERNKSIMRCVADYKKANHVDKPATWCFDIDGVLTIETEGHDYAKRTPNRKMIARVNELHMVGHRIILHTARWGTDWTVTKAWLYKYGVAHDELILGKPKADFYVDDKMIEMEKV